MNNQMKETEELKMDVTLIKRASLVLRAVNHKLRQDIIRLVHEHGRMTVTDIYRKLDVEQSVASQHLGILRSVGVVLTEREGKYIFYSINYDRLKDIHTRADQLIQFNHKRTQHLVLN